MADEDTLWIIGLAAFPVFPDDPPPSTGGHAMARRKFKKLRNAQQLSNKLGQFITYANAHLGTLTAINAGDITAMTTLKTNIDASIAARIAAIEAAKQA